MTFLFVAASLVALLYVLGLAIFLKIERSEGELTRHTRAPLAAPPLLSVVIPARNEEAAVGACVGSVLAQDYPNLELIVVDDQSTDRTGAILAEIAARDPRLSIVPGVPLAPGWLGKNHAIHQGVKRARGDWILFMDADGELLPGCLSAATADAVATEADLFTLAPTLVNGSFWERVVHPVLVMGIFALFPRDQIANPDSKVASANGPFLLFRRTAYEKIGGHEAVRGDIVEDLTLARKIKEAGLRLRYVSAPTLMRVRMYKSLGEIWNGWSKNFYAGAGGSFLGVILGTLLALAFGAGPWLLWPAAIPALLLGGWDPLLFGAAVSALTATVACLGFRVAMEKYLDPPRSHVWLQPLAVFILVGILWNSALRTRFGGGLAWKGRTYAGGKAS